MAIDDQDVTIPCGQCIGCRLEYSRQWAVRCLHESSLHDRNCFVTLTYDDDHLPSNRSLDLTHFQKFMKRLRRRFSDSKIRYFHCGEYGGLNGRPHYHACIFGFDFDDRQLLLVRNGHNIYTSAELQRLWPYGYSSVADLTFESAAYVARYVLKKITGDESDDHYATVDFNTGEYIKGGLKKEYTTMSLKPGIGYEWYDRYKSEVYPNDFLVINGKKVNPPKYYDNLLLNENPFLYDEVKHERELSSIRSYSNNTRARLDSRELCTRSRLNQKRPFGDL